MTFDPRITPARPDLAAAQLKGRIEAPRYAEGTPMRVAASHLDLRLTPEKTAPLATQLLHGEIFTVFETRADGLAWGQAEADGYVGYVGTLGLEPPGPEPDAKVTALTTHIYPKPDLKTPARTRLPFLSCVRILHRDGPFAALTGTSFCPAMHLSPLDKTEPDLTATAERFLGAPYLWGGKTVDGIDCSGLVQISLIAAGLRAPRDSDMLAGIGEEIAPDAPLKRGDIIAWKGHIGLMRDAETLIHATANTMMVDTEPLSVVIARIEAGGYGPVTARRRLS